MRSLAALLCLAHGAGFVVGGGAAVAVVGLLLCAAATELWMLYVGFGVLVGLGHALQFAPCPVAVAEAFDGSDRAALASGIATSGSGAGTAALGAMVAACVEIKISRRVRAESSRRPPRHRRDACSMAWRCRTRRTG